MSSASPTDPLPAEPAGPPVDPRSAEGREAIGFVLQLGRALHTYGYGAQRLEDVLLTASTRLGLTTPQFFSTPTSLNAAFGPTNEQRTFMLRVEPGQHDLGKLAQLDALTLRALRGLVTAAGAVAEIDRIVAAPPRYGPLLTALAFGLVSAAVARFFNGGLHEIAIGTVTGLVIGVLAWITTLAPPLGRVFEPVAAFVATALTTLLVIYAGPASLYIATVAGVIALLPGLTLTTAMSELADRHLVSGTARLSGAFMVFLAIAFGVALGNRVTEGIFGAVATAAPVPLPAWTLALALIAAPLAFTVILSAEPKDAPWILATGVIGFLGGRVGAAQLGLGVGAFAGALAVGVASNVYARWLDRPSAIVLVPGLTLLVPGSVGYQSLVLLMEKNVLVSVEAGFRMILTASSLVAGLLIANVIGPARVPPERRAVPRMQTGEWARPSSTSSS